MPLFRFSPLTLEVAERLLKSSTAVTSRQISELANDVWAETERWRSNRYGSPNDERMYIRRPDGGPSTFKLKANPDLKAAHGAILVADGLILVLMPIPIEKRAAQSAFSILREVCRFHDRRFCTTFKRHFQISSLADRLRKKRAMATEDEIRMLAEFVVGDAEPVFLPGDEPVDERIAANGFRLGSIGADAKYRVLAGLAPAGALAYGPFTELMILVPPGDGGLAAATDYLDVYIKNPTKIIKPRKKSREELKMQAALIALETSLENDEYPEPEITRSSWMMRSLELNA